MSVRYNGEESRGNMAAKRKVETQTLATVEATDTETQQLVRVVVWRALRKLTETEHKNLSDKIRHEEAQAGVRIILMPCACELETDGKEQVASGRGTTG